MDDNKIRTVDDEIAYNNYKLTADKILQLIANSFIGHFCRYFTLCGIAAT